MSRLQTKCVFASAAAHGLLLALLVVSAAFVNPPPKPDDVKFMRIFDAAKITDDETQGGGNPEAPSNVQPPVVQQPIVQQPPAPISEPPTRVPDPPVQKLVEPPPAPVHKREEPKKDVVKDTPKPPKPKPVDTAKVIKKPDGKKPIHDTKDTKEVTKVEPPKSEKPKIEVNLQVKKATPDPDAQRKREQAIREAKEEKERQEADRRAEIRRQMALVEEANRAQRERQNALAGIVGKLGGTHSTNVEMPPGPGNAAFINYADAIWTRYYQAWQTPDGRDIRTPVKVEIVVARDGRILSANIIRSSGDSALDRSVRQALDRVSKLPPFPEESKDSQRSFKINFELKSKHQFG
jgi:TolA protein